MAKLIKEPGYIEKFLNPKRRCKTHSAGASLFHLRDTELAPELATRLAPFIAAYAPDPYRDKKETRKQQLIEMGCEPVVKDGSFMEDFEELYFESHGYYPEENPELIDNGGYYEDV